MISDFENGCDEQRVKHFRIIEEIGRGAFSHVYRAVDEKLDRLVALKLLAGQAKSDETVQRFKQESVIAAKLNNENTVRVFESGISDGQYYIAYELIEGVSLREWMAFSEPNQGQVCRILLSIIKGLSCAHQIGIVHRDLKPENIIVDLFGVPKITDFGLASLPDQRLTTQDVSIGTVAYMSPEQASGNSSVATPRSDVFSIGVIFFEALTRRLPIQAATHAEYLASLANQEIMAIRDFDRTINVDLGAIVDKCLSRESRYRYRDADDLAEDLTKYIQGKPTNARPLSGGTRAFRFMRRHWRTVTFSTTALLALCFTTAVAVFYAIQSERSRKLEGESAQRAFDAIIDGIKNSKTEKLVETLEGLRQVKKDLRPRFDEVANSECVDPDAFNIKFASLYLFGNNDRALSKLLIDLENLSELEYQLVLELCGGLPSKIVEVAVNESVHENPSAGRLALISLYAGTGEFGAASAKHDQNQTDRFQLIDTIARIRNGTEIAKSILDRYVSDEASACVLTGIAEWPAIDDLSLRAQIISHFDSSIAHILSSAQFAIFNHQIEIGSATNEIELVSIAIEKKPFGILTTELTVEHLEKIKARAEIAKILEKLRVKTPGRGGLGPNLPITGLSFREITQICNALSEEAGLEQVYQNEKLDLTANGFRLPTFEEWSVAVAGGTQTDFFFGNDPRELSKYAVIMTAFENGSMIVRSRSRRPNALGLFDMFGNAAEVVHGDQSELLVIGGSAWASAEQCQPKKTTQFFASVTIGFRLVRNLF